MLRLLLVAGLLAAVCSEKARFDNYRVYSVLPQNERHLQSLRGLESDGYTFWKDVTRVNESVMVMVPPHKTAHFHDMVEHLDIPQEIYIQNVQKLIDEENNNPARRSERFGWTAYYRLADIYAWMDSLAETYPHVEVIKGGSTYEGRDIKGVKVIYNEANPGVFLEGGIHAREWISPATVTYILNQVLTNESETFRELVEKYNWYVFPSFNPDGYEYTHTHYRLWRKTRQPYSEFCFGADPNRNWNFKWMQGGADRIPCSDTHAGSEAFSEPETKSLAEFITTIKDNFRVYLGFHSFSQLLLIPYGYEGANKESEHVSNLPKLKEIAEKAVKTLENRYGTKYKYGIIVEAIYVASGSSMDWVRGTFDTPITYTYELRDTGRYAFLLPASQIIPTGEETLDSIVTILQESLSEI